MSTAFQGRYLVPVLALLAIGVVPALRLAHATGSSSGVRSAMLTTSAWAFVIAALATTTLGLVLHYY